MQICEKIYGDRPLLGDQVEGGWNVKFAREFDMTNDSHYFTSRRKLEDIGLLSPDEDTRDPRVRVRLWKNGYVPLYRGGDVFICDSTFSQQDTFLSKDHFKSSKYKAGKSIISRSIASSTNQRTLVVNLIENEFATGNSLITWATKKNPFPLLVQLSSFCIDWVLRRKVSANINVFFLEDLPTINFDKYYEILEQKIRALTSLIPISSFRTRLLLIVEIDAIIAELFSLDVEEFENLLLDFPLIDKTLPIEQRQTTLTLEAFKHLKQVGLERFLEEGWALPDYVTEFDRPGIKIWEPEGGWEKAWAEAKAMLTEKEWKEFTGDGVKHGNGSEQETEVKQAQQGLF